MAGNTKNLGQVSGVYIGSTPPENIILIWYDNAPSQMVHKIYNPGLSQWVVLDQNIITSITYSELVNIATNIGLTVGQWFKITDKNNALALAVTSTKVQYSDSLGNILIDDLGSNIQYHVSSSNLLIDDVTGVFDVVNKKLVFQFSEQVPDCIADDYILGKVKRNNIWSLAKFKLSSFLSSVTGNSITWNGGFFFNFSNAISNILDRDGGVVSKETYDADKQNISTDIQNVGRENQTIIENANIAISNATSDEAIYNKEIPTIEIGGEPIDAALGDRLVTIVSKFQRYINKFKFATGIKLSKSFASYTSKVLVNNNDTVESAFAKILYLINNIEASQIKNKTISESKIAAGVFPTDILRIDFHSTDALTGSSLGFCLVAGNTGLFVYDPLHPNNPYRMTTISSEYPIISFSPVLRVTTNNEYEYSIASTMPHYKGHLTSSNVLIGMCLQVQVYLSQERYDALYAQGARYMKLILNSIKIYNESITPAIQTTYISIARVMIYTIAFGVNDLTGSERDMILDFNVSFPNINS